MPPDPNELVHIKHAQVDGFGGPVTRQAVEDVYKHKGWSVATADEVAAAEEKARVAALSGDTASAGKEKK